MYDEIRVGSLPFKLRAGKENFLDDLIKKFPQEEKGIRKYVELCVQCNKDADTWFFSKCFASRIVQTLFNNFFGARFSKYASMSVDHVIRLECGITDPLLYAILNWSVRQLWIDTVKGQLLYSCWYCIALFKRRVLPHWWT